MDLVLSALCTLGLQYFPIHLPSSAYGLSMFSPPFTRMDRIPFCRLALVERGKRGIGRKSGRTVRDSVLVHTHTLRLIGQVTISHAMDSLKMINETELAGSEY